VAAVASSYLCKGNEGMSLIEHQSRMPARAKKAPVRVKLERINCDVSRSLPPDGDRSALIDRLKTSGRARRALWSARLRFGRYQVRRSSNSIDPP
jgi:hypothetical protein